ncbi:MAG: sulfotransferase family 2 domain-containing protein [Nitrospirae bacterium]|nr:sulfotransferase family 2 domain-containing protein [Nitrospirota bacterium]
MEFNMYKCVIKSLRSGIQKRIYGCLREKIFFLHIPKCGGTSIARAIRSRYHTPSANNSDGLVRLSSGASAGAANLVRGLNFPHDFSDDKHIQELREGLLLYFMSQQGVKFISGHFAFSDAGYRRFGDTYKFITVLRDPVKRFRSLYFFNKYKTDEHCKMNVDLAGFLNSQFGRSQGHEYVKFLGGVNEARDYTSPESIGRARENLGKFAVVGFLESLDVFAERFERCFGVRLKIGNKNRNPVNEADRASIITEEEEAGIREICRPDLEIYQYALERFGGKR